MTDLAELRWQDAVDVALLTLLLYRVYAWLRGTVALQVAVGMLTLVVTSYAANELGLVLSAYLLQAVSAVSVLVTVVIFRDEIRRALTRASPLRLLRRARPPAPRRDFTAVAESLFTLARKHVGALVVVVRRDPLRDHATGGTALDALVSGPLVEAIFHKESPLHDGALIIDSDRVVRAGAFLPLAQGELPGRFGTRHSAAIGLSEVSDAIVVAVSEERGEVSMAEGGTLTPLANASALARRLAQLAGPAPAPPPRRRAAARDAVIGAVIFVAVVAAWNVVANQRGVTEEVLVAVELRGAPATSRLEVVPAEVTLRLRGPRRNLVGLGRSDVHAWADVAGLKGGNAELLVVGTAAEGVQVAAVTPTHVTLLERRTLRIEPDGPGRSRVVRIDPPEVTLVGKSSAWKGITSVKTRPIAGSGRVGLVIRDGLRLVDDSPSAVEVTVEAK